MSMTNNALRLPDWEIVAVEERGDVVEVTARYLPFPEACPKCGVIGRLYRHGTAPVDYHDLPYGKRTLIRAEVQRIRSVKTGKPIDEIERLRRERGLIESVISSSKVQDDSIISRTTDTAN